MTTSTATRYAALGGLSVIALAAALASGAYLSKANAQPAPAALVAANSSTAATGSTPVAGITVTGTGTVSGTSDILRLDLGVETRGASVDEALGSANAAAAKVVAALKKAGVDAKDIRTSNLSINPNYTDKSVIDGYMVSEGVTATLRDLKTAGRIISDAVAAGGNASRVNGIQLDLEGTGPLLNDARTRAVADAKAKAEAYAAALGRDLGDLVSLSEVVSSPTPVSVMRDMVAGAAASPVPVSPGSQDVGVTVTAVYAFR